MRVFRTRGLVWPFLFAPMLLVVWLTSSAGVVEEVSAEPVAQTTTIPTITQRQILSVAINSDDSGSHYSNCLRYEPNNEIYIGYCDAIDPQPIVSGLRFNTSTLSNIAFEDITDIYLVLAVEKNVYTSTNTLAPITIRGHLTTNSPTFTNGSYPLSRSPLTNVFATWTMIPWDNSLQNSAYNNGFSRVQTPSLLPIVQEMKSTINWELGNPLTFIFQPTGSTPSTNVHRRFIAKERLTGAHARLVIEYTAPLLVSNSYYLESLSQSHLSDLACNIAESLKNDTTYAPVSLVALQIGQPYENNTIYTWSGEELEYRDVSEKILFLIRSYADCALEKGVYTRLIIAPSLNNYGSWVNLQSGKLWGNEIKYITRQVHKISDSSKLSLTIVSASDMETSFNDPVETLEWLKGVLATGAIPFVNVASIAGTPTQQMHPDRPSELARSFTIPNDIKLDVSHTWTVQQVLSMTYSVNPRVYSLPQIYATDEGNARQWLYLNTLKQGNRFLFEGLITQWGACNQNNNCGDLGNTPSEAWNQVIELFGNSSIGYLTDICWSNGSPSYCTFNQLR